MELVGNLTARGANTYGYDQANRLTSATVGGTSTTYTYDGDGRRVASTTAGMTTRYVQDVNTTLPVLLADGTRKYVWGAQGLAYAVSGSGVSESVEVSHSDGLGSVRALTDASGSVVQTYGADEFGIVDPQLTQGSRTQPFGYTGEPQAATTGLVDLRARVYDPSLGRFLQRDPISGSTTQPLTLNRFTYVGNNPVNLVDPSGEIAWVPALVGIGAFAGGITNTANYLVTNRENLSWGGGLEAFGEGAAAGAVATTVGVVVAVALPASTPAWMAAAVSGGTSNFASNAASNLLNNRPWDENWLYPTVAGTLLGPAAHHVFPQVGFRASYSVMRGLGSPRRGYVGANTRALYKQEAWFDATSGIANSSLSPWRPSGGPPWAPPPGGIKN